MPPRRRAHLLLPTPLGTVEYDVLEDAAFVGSGKRGGLTAEPLPFPKAVAAITAEADAFTLRALPGEPPPSVGGDPAEGRTLEDGDEVVLGKERFTFHTDVRPTPAAAATTTAAAGLARPDAAARRTRVQGPRLRANPWVTAVALSGALLLLVGLYLTLDHLGDLRAGDRVEVLIPEAPALPARRAMDLDAPGRAYAEVAAYEAEHPEDLTGTIQRYRSLLRSFPESAESDRARARIRERVDEAGRAGLERLEAECAMHVKAGRFRAALDATLHFERRYGATSSAARIEPLQREVRDAARKALEALLARVGPMVATQPRRAHRELLMAGADYPPDLASEVTALMEHAISRMKSQGRPPPEPRAPAPTRPVEPGQHPSDPPPEPPVREPGSEGDDTIVAEAQALRQWRQAYEALDAKRYEDALEAYTLLALRHGGTEVYQEHRRGIVAGRYAAKAGAQGPAGLLSVPVTERSGRLEIEYSFDDASVLQRDFTIEQPFPSDRTVSSEASQGSVLLEGATGLLHVLVWESDVRLEARVVAEVAHDVGALAIAESRELRALAFTLNNTVFGLKKGRARRAQSGHLIWFMGEGVWSAADEGDAIGFIKIAERSKVKLEDADRGTIEFVRRGERCEASYHGRTDGVRLEGEVKGDDGRGMGAARVGLFVNTGALRIEDLRISGRVDQAWFDGYVADLVAAAEAPPSGS